MIRLFGYGLIALGITLITLVCVLVARQEREGGEQHGEGTGEWPGRKH